MNRNDYIYLDHAATTPMREVAFEAYKKTEMDAYANSSVAMRCHEKQKTYSRNQGNILQVVLAQHLMK